MFTKDHLQQTLFLPDVPGDDRPCYELSVLCIVSCQHTTDKWQDTQWSDSDKCSVGWCRSVWSFYYFCSLSCHMSSCIMLIWNLVILKYWHIGILTCFDTWAENSDSDILTYLTTFVLITKLRSQKWLYLWTVKNICVANPIRINITLHCPPKYEACIEEIISELIRKS